MKKRKIIMARLVKRSEMDRSFDIEFWQRVGVQGRFEAAWQMVKDAHSIQKMLMNQDFRDLFKNIKRRKS